jgi:hypothetical protein
MVKRLAGKLADNMHLQVEAEEKAKTFHQNDVLADINPHVKLKNAGTLKWLKTRHGNKITPEYLFNESER